MKLEVRTLALAGRGPRLALCDENGTMLPGQTAVSYMGDRDKAEVTVTFRLDLEDIKVVAKEAAAT